MFNNKRTDSTYLKMKDGKVVNTPNPYPTEDDKYVELQDRDFYNYNESLQNEGNNPQNKKSKLLIIIGLCFIIIPFIFIGFNLSKNYISQLQEYMILGESSNANTDTNSNNSIINENAELQNPLSKTNVSDILDVTNMVNTSFKTSYSGLKTDIILFTENKESIYATRNKLQSRAVIVKSNKVIIENKKALFVKNKQEELYNVFMQRFELLSTTISTLESDINRTNAVTITNNAILEDNLLLDKEISLLKDMLNNNKINFTENENGISIKE